METKALNELIEKAAGLVGFEDLALRAREELTAVQVEYGRWKFLATGSTFDEAACLRFDPFADDFGGSEDRVLSNKIVTVKKDAVCHICAGVVAAGTRSRRHVARIDGELRSYRWCSACCEAMAASWSDEGVSLQARYALRKTEPVQQ